MRPVDTASLVSVWCWYRVGSKNERPGITGISHWVEHMNFKGTRLISLEDMKNRIERTGGTWNGYTFVDQTTYFETTAWTELDNLLELEAERMHACLYDPAEVESERTVILSELQGGENDPEELLEKETTAVAIKAHPYHWPTVGWESDIQELTRDDLYQYYRSYYVPNNATLVLVGNSIRTRRCGAWRLGSATYPRGPFRRRSRPASRNKEASAESCWSARVRLDSSGWPIRRQRSRTTISQPWRCSTPCWPAAKD